MRSYGMEIESTNIDFTAFIRVTVGRLRVRRDPIFDVNKKARMVQRAFWKISESTDPRDGEWDYRGVPQLRIIWGEIQSHFAKLDVYNNTNHRSHKSQLFYELKISRFRR